MSFLRGAGRLVLSVLMASFLSLWIVVMVLQSTLFNRQAVEGWLSNSGLYKNALSSTINLQSAGPTVIGNNELQQALSATFPPSYIQQQGEIIINSAYDWLEGKAQSISFSIPVNNLRNDFSNNLARALETKLNSLPPCPTRISPDSANPICLPQGMTAASYARQLSQLSNTDGAFLAAPITPRTLNNSSTATPSLNWLPSLVSATHWLLWLLPVMYVMCAGGFVFLSNSKIHGLLVVGRRTFFNSIIATLGGIALFIWGGTISLAALEGQAAGTNLVIAVLRQALPGIGFSLMLVGGAVSLAGLLTWIIAYVIKRRLQAKPTISPTPSSQPVSLPAPETTAKS